MHVTPSSARVLAGLALWLAAITPASGQAVAAPTIDFESTTWNFGEIKTGETVEHAFRFRNGGTADLIIQEARPACGCTVPSFDSKPVPPGGEGEIHVVFNSRARRGEQDRTIRVSTNVPGQSRVVLHVVGTVTVPPAPIIEVTPLRFDLGVISAERPGAAELLIGNAGELPLEILSIAGDPSVITAVVEGGKTIAPGAAAKVQVALAAFPSLEPGYLDVSLKISSNDPMDPEIDVGGVAYAATAPVARLGVPDEVIDVGVVSGAGLALAEIPLTNCGATPLRIVNLTITGAAVELATAPDFVIAPRATALVRVVSPAVLVPGAFHDRILVVAEIEGVLRRLSKTIFVQGHIAPSTPEKPQ